MDTFIVIVINLNLQIFLISPSIKAQLDNLQHPGVPIHQQVLGNQGLTPQDTKDFPFHPHLGRLEESGKH